jgi:drug/metabolite transporter superfamily protein YnfA
MFATENDSLFPQQQQQQQRQNQPQKKTWTLLAGLSGGSSGGGSFWTLARVVQAIAVFVMAGIAEIGGGWLVWKAVREHKPWWWGLAGSLTLVVYGFLPTLQPTDSFGRIYAVYGGFFIALSYAWGWLFDGMKPDTGDVVGGSLALLAVLVIMFWPRQQ